MSFDAQVGQNSYTPLFVRLSVPERTHDASAPNTIFLLSNFIRSDLPIATLIPLTH